MRKLSPGNAERGAAFMLIVTLLTCLYVLWGTDGLLLAAPEDPLDLRSIHGVAHASNPESALAGLSRSVDAQQRVASEVVRDVSVSARNIQSANRGNIEIAEIRLGRDVLLRRVAVGRAAVPDEVARRVSTNQSAWLAQRKTTIVWLYLAIATSLLTSCVAAGIDERYPSQLPSLIGRWRRIAPSPRLALIASTAALLPVVVEIIAGFWRAARGVDLGGLALWALFAVGSIFRAAGRELEHGKILRLQERLDSQDALLPKFLSAEIKRRDMSPVWRQAVVSALEQTPIPETQRPAVARDVLEQARLTVDRDDVVSQRTAIASIRRYASLEGEAGAPSLSPFLGASKPAIQQATLQGLSSIFSEHPPTSNSIIQELAREAARIALGNLRGRDFTAGRQSSLALAAIIAHVAMNGDDLSRLQAAIKKIERSWFREFVVRDLRELEERWRLNSVAGTAVTNLKAFAEKLK